MFDALPEAFGSYRVVEAMGIGRFGPVYRAREAASGLFAVIEVFEQGLTSDQAARLAEALDRLGQAPLNHPSIVPVLSAGAVDERAWVAEPWFDAVALDTLMQREGALPLTDVLERVTHVAAALDFAAAVGINHGALHPRDILVSHDQTVVTGIGVLQALSDAGLAVPMEGAYVSPQRAQGAAVSAADDIFSLAAITYELISGAPVPSPSELREASAPVPGIDPERFADVLARALSTAVSDRPTTALGFVAAIQETIVPSPIQSSDSPIPVADASDSDVPITHSPIPGPDIPLPHSEIPPPHSEPVPQSDSEIPIRPSIPDAHAATSPDLPLRAEVSESAIRSRLSKPSGPIRGAQLPNPNHASQLPNRNRASESKPSLWFTISATLAIGLLIGFAGGYVAGQREATPVPYAAARPVARNQATETPDSRRVEEAPAPTGGRDFTESVVPPGAAGADAPAVSPAEPQGMAEQRVIPPQSGDRTAPGSAVEEGGQRAPSDSGVLHVDSRPRGARVFVDGRLVGTTPVVVADVRPGTHAVRIDLSGYRRWVTTVDVAAGERQRVAASLER